MTRLDNTGRRAVLAGGVGLASLLILGPARATPARMQAAIADFTGGAMPGQGRIKLAIPPLVENGNSVSVRVEVESPMTEAEHVRAIAIFNEKNPQPQVATFHLSPRSGRAAVETRMRLADSQAITVVAAFSDGSFWSQSASVIVTLAACVEG